MRLLSRLRAVFTKPALDADFDAELAQHLEAATADNIRAGMTPEEARRQARIALGGVEQSRELHRDARGLPWLEDLVRDVRLSLRLFAKHRGFTTVALLVLALGMAGTAIIFGIFNGVFLKPWPFHEPDRLVDLNTTAPKWNQRFIGVAWPEFEAWRANNTTFDAMAVLQTGSVTLATETFAERVNVSRVSHDLTTVLGLEPVLGRGFTAEEDGPGAPPVALLGNRAWRTFFGADPGVLGRTVSINREVFTVIGVLPPGAAFPNDAGVWVPSANRSTAWCMLAVGRLKPGIAVETARADLQRVHRGLVAAGRANAATSPTVMKLTDRYVGEARVVGWALLAAGLVVLLVACGNVAALQVARGIARRGEMALRLALGASPGQIARQVVVESVLLCAGGSVLGILLARWLMDGFFGWLPSRLPAWVNLAMDGRFALGFAGLVLLSAVVCALLPARDAMRRRDLRAMIAAGPSSTGGAGRFASLRALVVGETAFAVTLLLTAGLLTEALHRVRTVDAGFSAGRVLTYVIKLTGPAYATPDARLAFFDEHLQRVRALPGVAEASASTSLPLSGNHVGVFVEPEGVEAAPAGAPEVTVHLRQVMPGYFSVMGIPVAAGRVFEAQDGASAGSHPVVVDEALARRFWPGERAVGKRLRFKGAAAPWHEVVGVVKTVLQGNLDEDTAPGLYCPHRQDPPENMAVVLRYTGDTAGLAPAIRDLVRTRDAGLVVQDLATMAERVDSSLWLRRFYSGAIGVFAGAALLLVGAGLFGVVSYVVQQRSRELGIRLALGASRSAVFRLVLREAFGLAGIGAGMGAVGGLAASGLLHALLFGVSPANPVVLGAVLLVLATVVLLACLAPAVRALRLNPAEILRAE